MSRQEAGNRNVPAETLHLAKGEITAVMTGKIIKILSENPNNTITTVRGKSKSTINPHKDIKNGMLDRLREFSRYMLQADEVILAGNIRESFLPALEPQERDHFLRFINQAHSLKTLDSL